MKKWLFWTIIILLIIAVGLIIYFLSNGGDTSTYSNQLNNIQPPPLPTD
jgi:hypothetical protein